MARAMFYDSNCTANYYDPEWLRGFAEHYRPTA